MKFRTDFVTNSSSSSFVLVVRIGLKNGKVLKFKGESGVGEYGEPYYEMVANTSPEELGRSQSIQELIDKLQNSIIEDGIWKENPRPVLTGKHSIIKELKKLSSMDEIEKITINGEEYGRDESQYKYYTYYRDMDIMFADEGGDEEIHTEGTGGAIEFYNCGMRGLNFGENLGDIDCDVEPDLKDLASKQARMNQSGSSSVVAFRSVFKSFDEYHSEMEDAYREGKPLEDMIEAGRKTVNADAYSDKDAFEQAIKNLDRNIVVTFSGKHFALTGFGDYEKDVIAEIEKRGGIVHSSMVKTADYLIVHLKSPGAAKVRKALEWRQKGVHNLIVSDYQMWRAIFGSEDAIISDKDETLIGEDAMLTAIAATDSLDAKKTMAPVEMEKPSATEMKSADSKAEKPETTPASTNIKREYSKEEWIAEFGQYVEKDPQIVFKGEVFVFDPRTKTSDNDGKVVDHGGITRQSVSRNTDYLIVSPECDALATLRKAIELKKKFDKIRIVMEEDLQTAIDRTPTIAQELYSVAEDGTLELSGETEIHQRAFKYNEKLKTIRIPEGVTHIDACAFEGCGALETIELPETLISIGEDAFGDCGSLTSVTFNERLESIGDMAFEGCTSLTSVTFNEGLKEIGRCAFYGCTSLTSVTFNEGLETIGALAFEDCTSLKSVTFNEGLKEIGENAFQDCTSLTSVTFNEGLKEIGEWAFGGCTSLKSLTLLVSEENALKAWLQCVSSCDFPTSKVVLRIPESLRGWAMENISEEMFQRIEYFPSARNSKVKLQQSSAQQPSANLSVNTQCQPNVSKPSQNTNVSNSLPAQLKVHAEQPNHSQIQPNIPPSKNQSVSTKAVLSDKEKRKKQLRRRIEKLQQEYNNTKGLLRIFKRRKIQKQIDRLREKLDRIRKGE